MKKSLSIALAVLSIASPPGPVRAKTSPGFNVEWR